MPTLQIRSGNTNDLLPIIEIYNHYVEHSTATFDTQAVDASQRVSWIGDFSDSGPHRLLVAESNSRVLGYAYSARFKERPAYRSSVETTIYMHADTAGQGYGQRLYAELFAQLENEASVHRAYGVIALPNPASVALHEQLGFRLVGTCHEVGFKFGKYWDVGWFEKEMPN